MTTTPFSTAELRERAARAAFFDMNNIMHDHEEHWAKANHTIWRSVAEAVLRELLSAPAAPREREMPTAEDCESLCREQRDYFRDQSRAAGNDLKQAAVYSAKATGAEMCHSGIRHLILRALAPSTSEGK